MKLQLLFLASASLLLSLHLNAQQATQVKSANQPYKLQYNNLKFGNPAYAQKVLQAWKDYENNKMNATASFMTDDAVGYFPDGTVVKGANNLNKLFKDVRNSFTSVSTEVYACTTLVSPDDPEHEFVVIWGKETNTKKDGTVQSTRIHEIWRINKEEKVDECLQYAIPENQGTETQSQAKKSDQVYPVLQNLSFGNPGYSEIVLKVWKDFENNAYNNSAASFADDVVSYSPHGNVYNGKENMLKRANEFRNSLDAVKFQITACTTLKSPDDPDHEMVMIWAERNYISKDGSILKTNGQEAWYFNKQGKIDKVYQFSAAAGQDKKLPIIDMHLHAYSTNEMIKLFNLTDYKHTQSEYESLIMTELKKYNIIGYASGPHEMVKKWHTSNPDHIKPGLFIWHPDELNFDSLRKWHEEGTLDVIGEIGIQYNGLLAGDSILEPIWKLAEELDIPLAFHMGTGAPNAPYAGFPKYRASNSNPLLIEDVLTRHPKVRVSIMHAGWPFLQEMISLLYYHPQVYVDLGVIDWAIPINNFHQYLKGLVDAGFANRIMFGTDEMLWPESIKTAIESIESASFLTNEQKRDIFYNNAVKFLRLSKDEIAIQNSIH